MDKGRKTNNNVKKVNGPQLRSPQTSRENLTGLSPKKGRGIPLRTRSSNDTTGFSSPPTLERNDIQDEKFKDLLKSMIADSLEKIIGGGGNVSQGGGAEEVSQRSLIERVLKLEQEVASNNALVIELQALKKRVAVLEEENKHVG
jgi:hypothetical protein